jgi:ADP-heptose:LPS heptosyltransferase
MTSLGIPPQGKELEFPLSAEDYEALDSVDEARSLRDAPYVCVHPGARDPARRWSFAGFAIVADALAKQGFQIVLTGTKDEIPLGAAVTNLMETRPLNLMGKTPIGALAVLLDGSDLVLCNDTGVSHLAVALDVPSVVVFTGVTSRSDPDRWAPLDETCHRAVWPQGGAVNGRQRVNARTVMREATDVLGLARAWNRKRANGQIRSYDRRRNQHVAQNRV